MIIGRLNLDLIFRCIITIRINMFIIINSIIIIMSDMALYR